MNKKSKKAPIFITIIIGAFIILLILINGNDGGVNGKDKLITLLEKKSFICDDNMCTQSYSQDGCELIGIVDFSKFIFKNKMSCPDPKNYSIETTYNWKAESLIQYSDGPGYSDMAVLDEKSEFSCNAGTTESCYAMKTFLLQHKNIFLNFVSEADLDIVDLK